MTPTSPIQPASAYLQLHIRRVQGELVPMPLETHAVQGHGIHVLHLQILQQRHSKQDIVVEGAPAALRVG
jgi:hypothetical protein